MIIKTLAVGLTLVTAWLAIAILAMVPGKISTAAVLKGSKLPSDIAIVGETKLLWIVQSDNENYVGNLYRNGAVLVLPARKKTCLDWRT